MRYIVPDEDVRIKLCPIHNEPFWRVGRRGGIGECYTCHKIRSRRLMRDYRLRKSPNKKALLRRRRKQAKRS